MNSAQGGGKDSKRTFSVTKGRDVVAVRGRSLLIGDEIEGSQPPTRKNHVQTERRRGDAHDRA